jgi:hypothetical protein
LLPSREIEFNGNDVLVSVEGKNLLKVQRLDKGLIQVEKGRYCPEFGKKYAEKPPRSKNSTSKTYVTMYYWQYNEAVCFWPILAIQ